MLFCVRGFWIEQRGEGSPLSYVLALMFSLFFIFFALDLGLRKGTRLAVEYAAFCAARAAAVEIPRSDEQRNGACMDDAKQVIEHAARACLSSVASKGGVTLSDQAMILPPGPFNPITQLIERLRGKVQISVQSEGGGPGTRGGSGSGGACFSHNDVLRVEVTYTDPFRLPLSPLSWVKSGPLQYRASARAMLHSVK